MMGFIAMKPISIVTSWYEAGENVEELHTQTVQVMSGNAWM